MLTVAGFHGIAPRGTSYLIVFYRSGFEQRLIPHRQVELARDTCLVLILLY